MVLRRSESTKTTFSIYATRKTKYQKWLGIVNVLMMLGSLCLIFFGLVLKLSYYMDHLGFVSGYFVALPWLLLSVGIITFILAGVGFVFSSTEERPLVLTYAYLTAALVLLQIATVFLCTESRREIDGGVFAKNLNQAIPNYRESQAVRDKWDYLQYRLRCCGSQGYTDYTSQYVPEYYKCVPATCCFTYGSRSSPSASCSDSLVENGGSRGERCVVENKLLNLIYMRGCVRILEQLYEVDLLGLMLIYAIGGTLLALVELVGVSLAFAFSAQMSRRAKKEKEWAPGEDVSRAGQQGLAMQDFPQDN